ncbi:MAG: hypothetical protein M3297_15590 [Thermoproteota archaeon]|nr:hypothetical protein [Thermoproteota archaeon]
MCEQPIFNLIYTGLDENDNTINAGKWDPIEEYNAMLDDFEMVADYNTANFTFSDGKFVKTKRLEHL